jgi:hypothetical protein
LARGKKPETNMGRERVEGSTGVNERRCTGSIGASTNITVILGGLLLYRNDFKTAIMPYLTTPIPMDGTQWLDTYRISATIRFLNGL